MKKKIIIALIICIIAIVAVSAFIILKSKGENKKNTDTTEISVEWGETYYEYIKDMPSSLEEVSSNKNEGNTVTYIRGIIYGTTSNIKAKFIDLDNDKTPELVGRYSAGDTNYVVVYYIDNGKINYKNPTEAEDIELLYDIKNDEYKYYYKRYWKNTNQYNYFPYIYDEYSEDPGESLVFDATEGNTLSEFDQRFIKIEDNSKEFEIEADMEEDNIKENVKSAVKDYNDFNEIVSDEVKKETEEKAKEIKEKTKEEQSKKEAEKQAKDEEEKKKAEEEAKQGIKVGDKIVKYGKYRGLYGAEGETMVINKDGTATITSDYNGVSNYTWSVGTYDFSQDLGSSYKDALLLKDSREEYGTIGYYVDDDGNLWLEPQCFEYVGE